MIESPRRKQRGMFLPFGSASHKLKGFQTIKDALAVSVQT
jgi:hypothetical protein